MTSDAAIARINAARVTYYAACSTLLASTLGPQHPVTLDCERLTANAEHWRNT